MDKRQLIAQLGLSPHVEGGYFARTYVAERNVATDAGQRALLSSIYYLLTDDSPVGHMHQNRSDILHYFHAGSPLLYWIVGGDGVLQKRILGPDLQQGQQLQLWVPGGCWKATELLDGEFGLISEAVAPGFDYADMRLADAASFKAEFPHLWLQMSRFIRNAPHAAEAV